MRLSLESCHFADGVFEFIILTENGCILIQMSPKCVPNIPINNPCNHCVYHGWSSYMTQYGATRTKIVLKTSTCNALQLQRGQFSQKYLQKTPHRSPWRATYGMSFVVSGSDWHSAWVLAMMFAISRYIGLRYNGTRLYIQRRPRPGE